MSSAADLAAAGAKGKTLLLVEDDPAFSQMLRWELEELGYELAVAHDCQEAREECCSHRFPVVVLDLDLPDGDGFELAEELARDCPAIKVIICSGRHLRPQAIPNAESAIHAVLTKPVSITRLTQLLSDAG